MIRKSMSVRGALVGLAAGIFVLAYGPAIAAPPNLPGTSDVRQIETYAYDLATYNAAAFAAVQGILSPYKATPWIYDLKGVAEPLIALTYNGQPWLAGTVCQPQDCGAHHLAFLVSADGKSPSALLSEDGKTRFVGAPDAGALAILAALLSQ